jgi:Tol biopolymer transport system component
MQPGLHRRLANAQNFREFSPDGKWVAYVSSESASQI